jgi:hypothetical protein
MCPILFYKYPAHLCLHKTVGFINAGKDTAFRRTDTPFKKGELKK